MYKTTDANTTMGERWLSTRPPKKSLVSELKWNISYLRLFGAYPVTIEGENLKPSNRLQRLNIIAAVAFAAFAFLIKDNSSDPQVLNLVVECIYVAAILGIVSFWICLARKTNILCRVFQSLHSVDLLLAGYGIQPNLRDHAIAAWIWTGLFHAITVINLVLEYFVPLWVLTGLLRFFLVEIYFTLLFILVSSGVFLLLVASHRFGIINDKLRIMAEEAERNKNFLVKLHLSPVNPQFFLHQTCSDLQKCHLLTSRACNDIMAIYGLPFVLALIYASSELCCNTYNTFATPLVHGIPFTFPLVFNWVKWAVWSISRFLAIVWPASYVAHTANETYDLVFELQAQISDPQVKRQLDSFSLQLNRPLEFRPLTLFVLDMNLFLSMLGCVATYVVILLQLHAAAPDIPAYV